MLLDDLRRSLAGPIRPGIADSGRYRPASVLVAVYGREPVVVMTEKPKSMRFHAGEISFPGGKADGCDADLLDTALREAQEEVGLTIKREQVIGQMEPVVTLNSGFLILPFVSVLDEVPRLLPNAEVETILHIPLEPFLGTMSPDTDPCHNAVRGMYTFRYMDMIVWGASARILVQIRDRLGS